MSRVAQSCISHISDFRMLTGINSRVVRLLFALLDAAEDDGLLRDFAGEARWQELKSLASSQRYETEVGPFCSLLAELETGGRLEHTWILERWHEVKARWN